MADKFNVNSQSLAVATMAQPWPMIDALVGGTAAMRQAGKAYLPKWGAERDEDYKIRLSQATLFPAFLHTTQVMAAKPFARPLEIDENTISPRVKPLIEDVDMYGTDLQPFAAGLMLDCLQKGIVGVLVDAPQAEGVRTLEEERKLGVRPYLTRYPAQSILGWRSNRDANGSHLTQLRLYEEALEPDGEWGERIVPQVRVFTPGNWEIWRKNEARTNLADPEWFQHAAGRTSLSKIPFVFFYGLRKDFGIGAPPLLDLAYMNVEHWQAASDRQSIVHFAQVPILFAKGFAETDKIIVGANAAARSSNKDADLRIVEHSGAAIEAGRQAMIDLEDRMRQTGAELLVQMPATTTATQVQTETEAGRSKLQKIVENFEGSLEDCLALMGEWFGDQSEPEVHLFKDFGAASLSEKGGDLLLRAASDGHVSSQTVFGTLKRMDIVPNEVNWDEEKQRIAQQPKPQDAPDDKSAPSPRDTEAA